MSANKVRRQNPLSWTVPAAWQGQTAAILGTGPSLPDLLARAPALPGLVRVVAVNDAHVLCPDADILYGCDLKWWRWHDGAAGFDGLRVTQDVEAAERYGLIWLPSENRAGLSRDPGLIHQGSNSGYQALNIATLMGAKKVLLLGFDHKNGQQPNRHYFGAHPTPGVSDFTKWNRELWPSTIRDLKQMGVDVVNCTPNSGLSVFRTGDLLRELP